MFLRLLAGLFGLGVNEAVKKAETQKRVDAVDVNAMVERWRQPGFDAEKWNKIYNEDFAPGWRERREEEKRKKMEQGKK